MSGLQQSRSRSKSKIFKMATSGNKLTMAVVASCLVIISALALIVMADQQPQKQQSQQKNKLQLKSNSDLDTSASQAVRAQLQPVYHSTIDKRSSFAAGSQDGIKQNLAMAAAAPQGTAATDDLATAAGHHHGHAHGKYYEYREVPKKKTWKFGYKRGNHKHTISRHEHGKSGKKHPHFKTKVKWHDKKSKGKGIHLWDYNHHDKKHGHYGK